MVKRGYRRQGSEERVGFFLALRWPLSFARPDIASACSVATETPSVASRSAVIRLLLGEPATPRPEPTPGRQHREAGRSLPRGPGVRDGRNPASAAEWACTFAPVSPRPSTTASNAHGVGR